MSALYLLPHAKLQQILLQLETMGAIPQSGAGLVATTGNVGEALRQAVLDEVPAFRDSSNPDVLPELQRHVEEHVGEIRRLFSGGPTGDFGFVRLHARRRAEQRFPLELSLHAYRCGHRVLSQWLREAVSRVVTSGSEQAVTAVADFAIEYTNIISTILASDYVAHTRALAEAEGDQRTELFNTLLSGYDESDQRVARILKRAGYLEQRQAYCVVAVQAVNATEMEHPERVQRIASAIADATAGTSIRTLTGMRSGLVTAILSDRRRQSGWTAPQSNLAERAQSLLQVLGPAVLAGISADHPSTSFLPKALHEALTALDFANVAERVVRFASLPVRGLLIHRGADAVQATPPGWLQALTQANTESAGTLVATLRAIGEADLNMQKAARRMGRHPNTLYARIERIRDITGLDPQRYRDLTELLLAADCWRL